MTTESVGVFAKFGISFTAVFIVMMGLNIATSESSTSTETPWTTFNPTSNDVHGGRKIMERNGCFSCHNVDGFGGTVGPQLNGVKERKSREDLFKWIQSPYSIKPTTRMPQYHLADEEILQIISYLETKDSLR